MLMVDTHWGYMLAWSKAIAYTIQGARMSASRVDAYDSYRFYFMHFLQSEGSDYASFESFNQFMAEHLPDCVDSDQPERFVNMKVHKRNVNWMREADQKLKKSGEPNNPKTCRSILTY